MTSKYQSQASSPNLMSRTYSKYSVGGGQKAVDKAIQKQLKAVRDERNSQL
jgi:hypothetical protein